MLEWTRARVADDVELHLAASAEGLRSVLFELPEIPEGEQNDRHPLLMETARQLRAYFMGQLREFDLPFDAQGTLFQKRVWSELVRIPYGETRSYGSIAEAIGAPKAVRAVGAANGANPLPIVVPCHRVIGKNGSLVGFGGGLPLKKRLLDLERHLANAQRSLEFPDSRAEARR